MLMGSVANAVLAHETEPTNETTVGIVEVVLWKKTQLA
jgi:hypothetical protein